MSRLSEKETRANILKTARKFNCEGDVKAIFNRYDKALKNCTNEQERQAIAAMGAAELHRFLGCKKELVLDGKEILPAQSGYENVKTPGRVIKLD